MFNIFVESSLFAKYRAGYLTDEEYRKFQNDLMINPLRGNLLEGSGGLRKVRVAGKGKGKRGAYRVIYYYLDNQARFYLLTIYSKNEVADLTPAETKLLKEFVQEWRNEQS